KPFPVLGDLVIELPGLFTAPDGSPLFAFPSATFEIVKTLEHLRVSLRYAAHEHIAFRFQLAFLPADDRTEVRTALQLEGIFRSVQTGQGQIGRVHGNNSLYRKAIEAGGLGEDRQRASLWNVRQLQDVPPGLVRKKIPNRPDGGFPCATARAHDVEAARVHV